jgi:hypothetical protein
MSVAVKIEVEKDTATPGLKELAGQVSPSRMAAAIGPRCTRLMQRNFRGLGTNARGWPTTKFYERAENATNWRPGEGFVDIVVTSPIGLRQRLHGGEIRPVNAKMLTIPARAEAYGKRAGEFTNLKFAVVVDPSSGRFRPALVERAGIMNLKLGRKKKDGTRTAKVVSMSTGLVPLFWLVRSVRQKPNPKVLPSDEQFWAAIEESMKSVMRGGKE